LRDAAQKTNTSFDAIVIDEGQDFSSDWVSALLFLTSETPDGPVYIFMDSHQKLYRRYWEPPDDWTQYDLTLNCRNSAPIAQRVAAIFAEQAVEGGAPGPIPTFYEVPPTEELSAFVQEVVFRLMEEEGIRPGNIVVLSDSYKLVERLNATFVGSCPFVRYGTPGVVAETIARFKGLESEVVVLALTEELMSHAEGHALAYVGISRAKAALFVCGSRSVRSFINWA
jgi:superfamily I DNA/RNA helicase